MTERWRLFVAVPIGSELRDSLAASVRDWSAREDLAGLRWSDPASWHLTVHFLGATPPTAVASIVRSLEHLASGHSPMRLATGGLGGFPSPARARVAWYGVDDGDGSLGRLAGVVRQAFASTDEAIAFRPHVTLARARRGPVDLRRWLREADAPIGELDIAGLSLMRSHLGAGPARYEALATVPLGVPVRA